MEAVPLVDELIVIDSASEDATREIAAREGARVVQHPDVLARYGSYRGKGEALWKSLFESSGDIVVWCDTDVRNWHPRMAYGTLGPLLVESRIQYVKGYYQRPIVEGGVLREGGGAGSPSWSHGRSSTCSTPTCRASSSRSRANTRAVAACSRRSRSSPATPWRSGT